MATLAPTVTATPPTTAAELAGNAREAIVGIPADLAAGRGSLYEVFTRNDRLRGLGVLFLVVGLLIAIAGLFR